MEILLTTTYTLLFFYIIRKHSFFLVHGLSGQLLNLGFALKLIAGISVGLVYTYYYTDRLTADTFRLFDDSIIVFNTFQQNPYDFFRIITGFRANAPELSHYYNEMSNWYDVYSPVNDNRTMIRINALLRFISFGHYYVHVVIICFLAFTGIVAIVKVFGEKFGHLSIDIFLAFIVLPSVLFWGSGLLKDAMVFFPLGLSLYAMHNLLMKTTRPLIQIGFLALCLLLLMITKFQVFMLICPLLLAWWIAERHKKNPILVFFSVFAVSIGLLSVAGKYYDNLNIASLLASKQSAFIKLADQENAGSFITIPPIKPSLISIISNAPLGFINSVSRPFFTDPGPLLSKLFAIENFILIIFALWRIRFIKWQLIFNDPLTVFCLFYAVIYLSIIGMVTPVLGAMVRYKIQAIPFLITWLMIISTSDKKSLTGHWLKKQFKI